MRNVTLCATPCTACATPQKSPPTTRAVAGRTLPLLALALGTFSIGTSEFASMA